MYVDSEGLIVLETIQEMAEERLKLKKEKNFKAADAFRNYVAYFHFLKIIDLPDDKYELRYFSSVEEFEAWLDNLNKSINEDKNENN